MTENADLLAIRLEALELDITKVRDAVEVAKRRGRQLEQAVTSLKPQRRVLNAMRMHLDSLVEAMRDEPKIADLVGEQVDRLPDDLVRDTEAFETVIGAVSETVCVLERAIRDTLTLNSESIGRLQTSLNQRCEEVDQSLRGLRKDLASTGLDARREQWQRYQSLLDDKARPVFMEYVDFLGGLTVRDTGLDDRVCEMTDALLRRYTGIAPQALPLPARQAALGSALDSVVLLGFPEWSIWGIPLVAHEVGLAYAHDLNDPALPDLVDRFSGDPGPDPLGVEGGSAPRRTTKYVRELLADAFATYTLGLSYACAALLLRLSPRHDDPYDPTQPRDLERARVIMLVLLTGGDTSPVPGGSFTDEVQVLQDTWRDAVRAYAAPGEAAAALKESVGPPPERDWLDEFASAAVELFRHRMTIRPYNEERWRASSTWLEALQDGTSAPGWITPEDAVPDALTAAWRLRLLPQTRPHDLAERVKQAWSGRGRGV